MDHRIHQLNYHPLLQLQQKEKNQIQPTKSFKGELENKLNSKRREDTSSLTISKHAQKRLMDRKINIDSNTWSAIQKRVDEAKMKGIKESLVITEEAALIVSVKNNTVITAMNRKEASSQIFTNINGTIIV